MTYNNQNATATARAALDRAADQAAGLGHDAADAAKSLGHKATVAVDQASDMAHEKLEAMAHYVRRNPLQATAIAAGVGFLFALIARR